MVHTVVDGTFRQTNLTNESSEYLAKREELRLAAFSSELFQVLCPRSSVGLQRPGD